MFSPLDAAQALQKSILRYVRSSLPLGYRSDQATLGEYFHARLEKTQFRGPYVEAQQPYASGLSLSELCAGAPSSGLSALMDRAAALTEADFQGSARAAFRRIAGADWQNPAASVWSRPLYAHQQRAFNLVVGGKSCVIATGTGSGKTECYLYPLLELLASEAPQCRAEPGIRSILLFPMNALVEDQLRRLRGLLLPLNAASPGVLARRITFGRYTGQTPRDDADTDRPKPEQHIQELGEMLTRKEMFSAPPDILVTNFSMLEYALLRPADHALFHGAGRFRMLVLDEAHAYSGTVGAEVAMLLRRVRATLAPGRQLVFVGTSATLGSKPEHLEAMAEFASKLFDEEVPSDRIITAPAAAPPLPPVVPGLAERADDVAALSTRLLMRLIGGHADVDDELEGWPSRLADDAEQLARLAGARWDGMEAEISDTEAWSQDPEANARRLLGKIFAASDVFRRLKALVTASGGCREVSVLAADLFATGGAAPGPGLVKATEVLLTAAANAHVGGRAALAARYHFFVGEQGEAYLCLNPDCPGRDSGDDGWWSRLFLSHHARCPSCSGLAFALRLCRKCGFVLLEAWRPANSSVILPESDPDQASQRLLFRPAGEEAEFEGARSRRLCVLTGNWFETSDTGGHAEKEHRAGCPGRVIRIAEWSNAGNIKLEKCPECDQEWYQDEEVFTAPSISPYAAASVMLEEATRCLRGAHLGSQILSFSDSRQQAAKLAARLQRTNRDYAFRQLVWRAVLEANGELSSCKLLDRLFERVNEDSRLVRLFAADPADTSDSAMKRALGELLFREAASPYRSLESIGVVAVAYTPELQETALSLRIPAGLGNSDGLRGGALRAMLDLGFRYRACMGSAESAIPLSEPNLQRWRLYRSMISARDLPRGSATTTALFLKQFTRRNVLLNLVERACKRAGFGLDLAQFNDTIGSFWESVFVRQKLLTKGCSRSERGHPLITTSFVGESACLQLNFNALLWELPGAGSLFQCSKCRRVTAINLAAVCPVRDCDGSLWPIEPEQLDAPGSPVAHYRQLVEQEPAPLRVEEHTAEISPRRRAEIERDFREGGAESVDVISGSTTFELGIDIGTINAVYMANLPPRLANYRQRAGRAGRAGGASPLIVSYVRQRPHDQYFWRDIGGFISGPVPPPKFKLSSREILQRHGFSLLTGAALRRYDNAGRPKGGLWGPKWSDFSRYMAEMGAGGWAVAGADCAAVLKAVFAGVDQQLAVELQPGRIVAALEERLQRAQPLLSQRADDGVIEVLSDYGILPAYSFPIYVDEMRLFKCQPQDRPRRDLSLTRDRRISLAEYYPGRIITAGGYQIRSLGLWEGFEDRALARCPSCGQVTPRGSGQRCGCSTPPKHINAVVPWGGFYGETILDESPPELEREANASSEVEFDPAGDPPPLDRTEGVALTVAFFEANLMKLARMRQFSPRLGSDALRLLPTRERDVGWHWIERKSLRIPGPNEAHKAAAYHLLHEFTTDAIRLRFCDHPAARPLLAREGGDLSRAWATLGEALLAASARFLDIDDVANSELGVTFRPYVGALGGRDLVLYDTAAGGAGYARAIGENLREVFGSALDIITQCECGDSCYRCLRSYRNQHLHARLDRMLVSDGLARFVAANWPSFARSQAAAGL